MVGMYCRSASNVSSSAGQLHELKLVRRGTNDRDRSSRSAKQAASAPVEIRAHHAEVRCISQCISRRIARLMQSKIRPIGALCGSLGSVLPCVEPIASIMTRSRSRFAVEKVGTFSRFPRCCPFFRREVDSCTKVSPPEPTMSRSRA